MMKIDQAAFVGRRNAICLPSGDQVGKLSRAFVVRRRTCLPSASILTIPMPLRANAMFFPSGEKAGAIDGYGPLVTRLSPVPEVRMRKSWSTCWPGGTAEKTIHLADAAPPAVAAAAPSRSATAPDAIRTSDRRLTLDSIAAV